MIDEDHCALDWLKSVNTLKNHDTACGKHEPTIGNWLLQSDQFVEWMKATKGSFWLYGNPGVGKTDLCSTIIEHVKEECKCNPRDQYVYFYFDFNEERSLRHMIPSIVRQLCIRKKEVPSELHQLYEEYDNGRHEPSAARLLIAFSSLLRESHRTFVILDALDECKVGTDRNQLLQAVKDMTAMNLNVLVTSRKEKDITDKLEGLINHQVYLSEDIVARDIVLYIRNRLKNDDKLQRWNKSVDIENALIKGAYGM